ncbi:hypothetical protein [Mycolicibacterium peregrinum]|uniref:hypothetical protein n=1 Tax=Mycolicibacterium peregrinum TaxID=43304 RepID=UPI003AAB9B21
MFVDLLYPYPFTSTKLFNRARRRTDQPGTGGGAPQGDNDGGQGGQQQNPPADPPNDGQQPQDPPDRGFPANTPIKDMTAEQQAAYWKFHDRRKSDTLSAYEGITPEQAKQWKKDADEARRNQLQPSERALEDARSEAAATASQAAATEWAGQLTEAIVGQFVQEEAQRSAVLAGINPMTFVKDGKFDKDALVGHLTGLATAFGGAPAGEPLPRQWGQGGSRPPATSGRDEGLAEAKRRGYIKD